MDQTEKTPLNPKKLKGDEVDTDPYQDLPVDKGWAWVVLAASFLSTVLAVGYFRSFGILFVEFLKMYDVPTSVTSLIMGIQGASLSVAGFITQSILMSNFHERTIVIVGGLLMGSGVMASTIANSIPALIITQSIMVGCGLAMVMGPVIMILNKYFNKRRSLAVAMSTIGANVGAIVFPPFVRYLLDEFGFRGTFIITGAVMLNIMVFGLFLRPFNLADIRRTENARKKSLINDYQTGAAECIEDSPLDTEIKGTSKSPSIQRTHSQSPKSKPRSPMRQSLPDLLIYSCPVVWDDDDEDNDDDVDDQPFFEGSKKPASESALKQASGNCLSVFNFALFKNPLFLIVVACAIFGIHSATTMNIYIPALAKGKGIPKLKAALLLSIVGATGIVGRLFVGVIADLSIVKRSLLMAFALAASGVSALCAPLYDDFETMIIYCVVYGFFGGLYFSLLPIVLVDFLGEKQLSTSFGFLQLFSGASMAAVNPIAGWLHDLEGNYDVPYQLFGSLSVIAGVILLLETFITRRRS
ncbi:monocarboxylate transporter 5-like [Gigantopelta aegis]|uniref:monocarboxylate transporter 5-like n=1 Tax=Gigantopelta aegis TaxID=1735272 RepID=UPI001B88BAF9|nr:monocarboxylate transporter 5-like [Gigantopelta aegis]